MAAQAIPSYAPRQAAAHFTKLECFCFNQYTLGPVKEEWPVAFVIDPKLSKPTTTITLSYTFLKVGENAVPLNRRPLPSVSGVTVSCQQVRECSWAIETPFSAATQGSLVAHGARGLHGPDWFA